MKKGLLSILGLFLLTPLRAEPLPEIINYDGKSAYVYYEGKRTVFWNEFGTTNMFPMERVIPNLYTIPLQTSTNKNREVKFYRAIAK